MIWTLLTVVLAQDVGESDEVLPVPEGEIEEPQRGPSVNVDASFHWLRSSSSTSGFSHRA